MDFLKHKNTWKPQTTAGKKGILAHLKKTQIRESLAGVALISTHSYSSIAALLTAFDVQLAPGQKPLLPPR